MSELEWLGVVRHGESTGNVAALSAETAGLEMIDIPERDADVPLSDNGRRQSAAVGRWLAALPESERPETVIVSPYLRTVQTAEVALAAAGLAGDAGVAGAPGAAGAGLPTARDERLRDRELGILDLMTARGVRLRLPDEARRRQRLGKFYYRPPGGESWADVALRLRGLLADLRRDHADGRVLLVAHEAVVFLLRYLIEQLTEAELATLAVDGTIGNCSITTWRRGPDGQLSIVDFNDVRHLAEEGARRTEEAEVSAEPI